jgi:hypothetical protein
MLNSSWGKGHFPVVQTAQGLLLPIQLKRRFWEVYALEHRPRLATYWQISCMFAHQGTTGIGSPDMQFIQVHLQAEGSASMASVMLASATLGELELRRPGRGTHRSTYPYSHFSVLSQPLHRANSSGRGMLLMKANTMLDMPCD